MSQETDALPYYAFAAAAVGSMDPAGRVLAELVGRRECSDGARYAQLAVINQLARTGDPFTFTGQLQKLAGDAWHPGNVNYLFLKASQDGAFQLLFRNRSQNLTPDRTLPSAAEMLFEQAIERRWEAWMNRITQIAGPIPPRLVDAFTEAVQLPLRRDLCKQLHEALTAMPGYLAGRGAQGYGEEYQWSYPRLLESLTALGGDFLEFVEQRAAALLQTDEQYRASAEDTAEMAPVQQGPAE